MNEKKTPENNTSGSNTPENNTTGANLLILIVEDDAEMAQLNARLLKRRGYDVLVAYNAAQARLIVQEHNKTPDLFVLDVGLPDGDGFSLCREFRRGNDAPVLYLTGRTETEDKIKGLGAGGDYYLTKPYDRNEFLAVVKSLLRRAEQARKKVDEASVITKGPLTLKLAESKAYIDGHDAELSSKEFAVLLILVQNEDKEVSYEQLYESVWGMPMHQNTSALRQQISRLKKKLDEENAEDFAIFTEQGRGYTFTVYKT